MGPYSKSDLYRRKLNNIRDESGVHRVEVEVCVMEKLVTWGHHISKRFDHNLISVLLLSCEEFLFLRNKNKT